MFESSIFVNLLSRFIRYIAFLWSDSAVGRACRRFSVWFMRIWSGSAILGFFKKDGYLVRIWEHSKVLSFFDWLTNIVPVILNKFYTRFLEAFEGSLLFRAVRFISRQVPILIALFAALDLFYPNTGFIKDWNNGWTTYVVIVLFGFFLIDAMSDKRVKFAFKIMDVFMFIFMLSIALAQIFSVYPSLSMRFLVFYGTDFVMMFLMVSTIKTKEQLATVLEIILAGAAICGVYGLYQAIKGVPVNLAQVDLTLNPGMPGRVYGAFDNSNNYAQIIVMFIPFFAAVVMNSKGWQKKVIFSLAAIPLIVVLLMTFSRSGYIGFAVAVLVFIFLVKRSLIPLFFALGIISIPFLPDTIQNRIGTITNMKDTSTATRFQIWQTIWPAVRDFWYTGLGLGSDAVHQVTSNYEIYTKTIPLHAHNIYLQIWLETGIVGLLSFLGSMARTIKRSLRIIFDKNGDKYLQNVLKAGVSGLIGILVIATVEYIWYLTREMLLFWILIAIILTAIKLSAAHKEEGPAK